ncbi:DUF3270 family protein [Streptococcus himalayensis]|uniref:Membrane protein n=1 Tax=Streptococcus himalayensis TaxID=1888195 RepID=A0A917AC40_9STRE|nr:DUF3270 family protein [Streptococcus himalayensis]GGE37757.1 membrane protein [Streptococcus himalayensis]
MNARRFQSPQEDYHYEYDDVKQEETSLYQEYAPEEELGPDLKELLFFVNIAIFCVLTALFSFFFLSLKFNAFLSFGAAMSVSLGILKTYQIIQERYKTQETTEEDL